MFLSTHGQIAFFLVVACGISFCAAFALSDYQPSKPSDLPEAGANGQSPEKPSDSSSEASTPRPAPPASAGVGEGDRTKQSKKESPDDKAAVSAEFLAVVIEVDGSVHWAPAGTSANRDEGWTAVKVGDGLPAGVLLRTGIRSHVNLRFSELTYMSIRSATYASIEQFRRSATQEDIRIGLGYGTVRGGTIEGTFESNVVVESPPATLAKRGTEGWQMRVEPTSGQFRISLARSGLVEAIAKRGGKRVASRKVRPGEYATRDNIANLWIDQELFDRNIEFYAAAGLTEAELEFMNVNTDGMGMIAPGAGASLTDFTGRNDPGWVRAVLDARFGQDSTFPMNLSSDSGNPPVVVLEPLPRPEGNFGTDKTYKAMTRMRLLLPHK